MWVGRHQAAAAGARLGGGGSARNQARGGQAPVLVGGQAPGWGVGRAWTELL